MAAVFILMVIFAGIALITYVDNTTRASRRVKPSLPESQTPLPPVSSQSLAPVVATASQVLRLPPAQREQAWTLLCLIEDELTSGRYEADARTRYLLEQTAQTYLPDTLGAFLQLTPGARQHLQMQGQDPATLLTEQLTLIEDGVKNALQHDHAAADRLLTQGRFLRERFGEAENAIPLPTESQR